MNPHSKLDHEKLSTMVKSKRGKQGLRQTAKEIGNVSASTLSRIEQGNLPDMETYLRLCDWLEVSTDYFIVKKKGMETQSNSQKVVAHLRADKTLDPETADALVRMITLAYQQANPQIK